MSQMLTSFLQGLAGMGPVLSLGLLPASYQAICRRPDRAVSYALAAGLQIPVLAALGWLMDRYFIPSFLATLLRPLLLTTLLWALQAFLSLLFKQSPVGGQVSFFNQGILALGTSFYLSFKPKIGLEEVLPLAMGWSLGFLISTTALSFLLRKIDEKENSPLVSGWPIFLIVLSGLWLAAKGLLGLLP